MECYYGEVSMSVADCLDEAQQWFVEGDVDLWVAWLVTASRIAYNDKQYYRSWVPVEERSR